DPMPCGRGHDDVVASTAVVPVLKRRSLDRDVAEGGEPLASDSGHIDAGLDGGHRPAKRRQRARCLSGAAAHLEHRDWLVPAGDADEICEELVGVTRPDAVVQLWHVIENPTEVTSILLHHRTIVPCHVHRMCTGI